jgi:hypothetical protein
MPFGAIFTRVRPGVMTFLHQWLPDYGNSEAIFKGRRPTPWGRGVADKGITQLHNKNVR